MHTHLPMRHCLLMSIAVVIAVLSLSLLSSCESELSSHTLTFQANGGEGTMTAISLREGEATTLPSCTFSKSGYVFAGWMTDNGASTPASYIDKASYAIGNADVVFYAKWLRELIFSSPSQFTLRAESKGWNGTLEYSTNGSTWTTWNGESISSTGSSSRNGFLYLRGTGNTKITGMDRYKWRLQGENISCSGNIENLLDYSTVANGLHPAMGVNCYEALFSDCPLISAPTLPATTLSVGCYRSMFASCSNLTTTPALPATEMLEDCYKGMFSGCTKLTTAPALPATTLADRCYSSMFKNCTALETLPALPATGMKVRCYESMFMNCSSIKLSETSTGVYTKAYRLPYSGDGAETDYWYAEMFTGTGGIFIGDPTINTTYYTSNTIVGP